LKLAEDLIIRTVPDLRQQIPVVFNLSSWARKPQTVEKWLVQELLEKYQVSKALGETWVKSEALILLLDGLDEVQADQRNTCVQALNLFMQNHGTTEVVVCCRIRDYQALKDRLTLRSAICIQPLTLKQVNNYFARAGKQLSALKIVLPLDKVLQELATSPLMLSIMSLAYQDFTPEQLTLGGKSEDYRKRLFETYVDRMFQRRGTTQQYSREETQQWLIRLAQWMKIAAQTIFLIERLQPSYLLNKRQITLYLFESCFIGGLILEPSFGILCWLLYGQDVGIVMGILAALYALASGLIFERRLLSKRYIKPVDKLHWCWRQSINLFVFGIIFGLILITFSMLFRNWNNMKTFELLIKSDITKLVVPIWDSKIIISIASYCMQIGAIFGVLGGVYGDLLSESNDFEIQQTEKTNQGILRSAYNSVIIGISCLVVVEMTSRIFGNSHRGLFVGLSVGPFGWYKYGGNTCIDHFILRLMLYQNKYAPWNYARFLNYATDRLFMQKVGGGYIFMHRMLLEHFAEMSIEQEQR
jgi:hypothetical protein